MSKGMKNETKYDRLNKSKVAIAGLGGLGSNVAVMLARSGVGKLLLIDFDTVEQGNLNRQHYNTSHLGMLKTEALKRQLEIINPYMELDVRNIKLNQDNILETLKDYELICEAFDDPVSKAMLVNILLSQDGKKVVAASGMAGLDDANEIKTKCIFKNLYVCGDFRTDVTESTGMMAPRVMICAGHQANTIIRLLLGLD